MCLHSRANDEPCCFAILFENRDLRYSRRPKSKSSQQLWLEPNLRRRFVDLLHIFPIGSIHVGLLIFIHPAILCYTFYDEQKWSKGKLREKLNSKVLFDEDGWLRLQAEVPKVLNASILNYSLFWSGRIMINHWFHILLLFNRL